MTISVTGCSTCRRVLTSMNENSPLGRLVEELDGAGAAVAGQRGEPDGGLGQLALLLGRQRRAGRLLDDLLVAALVAAVAHAERPHAALAVGHQLHLDVARGADEALHQHARVAERRLGLGAGALERARRARPASSTRRIPRPPPPAAALIISGKPSCSPWPARLLDALHRPAAPGRDRHAGLLGQPLALDLVAERAHDVRVGPDEHDPEPLAQLRERGCSATKPQPTHAASARVSTSARSSALVVEVGAGAAPSAS